jgi:hypothetical protein
MSGLLAVGAVLLLAGDWRRPALTEAVRAAPPGAAAPPASAPAAAPAPAPPEPAVPVIAAGAAPAEPEHRHRHRRPRPVDDDAILPPTLDDAAP